MDFCPDCRGNGDTLALVDTADGRGGLWTVRCATCQGSGTVDPELREWQPWADRVRRARVEQRKHLGQASEATGIRLTRYSAIERGVAIPTEGEAECIEAFTGVNR
jgi:hypothetical protein